MYEMTVKIRRSNPKMLVDDFNAVTAFLERRGIEMYAPSADEAVRAAEYLVSRSGYRPT
jgi:hypothetical protein